MVSRAEDVNPLRQVVVDLRSMYASRKPAPAMNAQLNEWNNLTVACATSLAKTALPAATYTPDRKLQCHQQTSQETQRESHHRLVLAGT